MAVKGPAHARTVVNVRSDEGARMTDAGKLQTSTKEDA